MTGVGEKKTEEEKKQERQGIYSLWKMYTMHTVIYSSYQIF